MAFIYSGFQLILVLKADQYETPDIVQICSM